MTFEVLRPLWPEGIVAWHAFAIGRIGDYPSWLTIRLHLSGITHFESDCVWREHGAFTICARGLHHAGVEVYADERSVQPGGNSLAGVILDVTPVAGIVVAQAFEAEWTPDAGGHAEGHPGGFDQQSATAAERVKQGRGRVPVG